MRSGGAGLVAPRIQFEGNPILCSTFFLGLVINLRVSEEIAYLVRPRSPALSNVILSVVRGIVC